MLEVRQNLSEIYAKSNEEHNIIRTQDQSACRRKEERATKNRDDAGGRRKIEIAEWMAQYSGALRNNRAFHCCVVKTQIPLDQQQFFMGDFLLQFADMRFDSSQTVLKVTDLPGGCGNHSGDIDVGLKERSYPSGSSG